MPDYSDAHAPESSGRVTPNVRTGAKLNRTRRLKSMHLRDALHDVMAEFLRRQGQAEGGVCRVEVKDCWTFRILCDLPWFPGLCIRSLNGDDVPALQNFSARLGAASRNLFCPYPWDDPAALPAALRKAVEHSVERTDASYLMEGPHDVIGHFFLWKAGGNPHSRRYHVQVPELGVAIADEFQGKGLGNLAVRILQLAARALHADAIELTTAPTNEAGWNTYQRCGFQHTGTINNPLEVDVTAAVAGEVQAEKYRQERQMVYVINEEKRGLVLNYLAATREATAGMTGRTSDGPASLE